MEDNRSVMVGERNDWLKKYSLINNTFKQKLIFRIGAEAGFFSEYNNMVLAMLYCLNHNIKFVLYSENANFSLEKGWVDFFEPFCEESKGIYHSIYNLRPYQVSSSKKAKIKTKLLKLFTNANFLTQDIWEFHRNDSFLNELFSFPELGMHNASVLEAAKIVIKNIWAYSDSSKDYIDRIKSGIKFDDQYISMHIRSGDKFLESELYNIDQYMKVAEDLSDTREVFVLTDDYLIIDKLREKYTAWKFQTLCDVSERGYYHQDFIRQSKQYRYEQHLKLFASMDICASSEKFIGTYSSNPGMYMGMRIGEDNCRCLDFDKWVMW